eukprot:417031_1
MVLWITTMQKAIRFDGNKQKYGSRRWFYGSLRCKKRSVSMEISTDSDPKDGFMDHYDAKSEPFRWKQAEIWIQKMVLWITTMQKAIGFDGNKRRYGSKRWFCGFIQSKKRSVSIEISTDTDHTDGSKASFCGSR